MANWDQKFKGTIWVVEQQEQPNGKVFELARRTPGVRLIVLNDQDQILLNKESRHELEGSFDLRLPGGKVFDDIDAWLEAVNGNEDLLEHAKRAAVSEAHQECGLILKTDDIELVRKDINGGKGEWDLYYFVVYEFEVDPDGPSFHGTEADEIEGWTWFNKEEALNLALDVQTGMSESRTARYVAAWAQGRI